MVGVRFGGENTFSFGHFGFEVLRRQLIISVRSLGDKSGKENS